MQASSYASLRSAKDSLTYQDRVLQDIAQKPEVRTPGLTEADFRLVCLGRSPETLIARIRNAPQYCINPACLYVHAVIRSGHLLSKCGSAESKKRDFFQDSPLKYKEAGKGIQRY